MEFVNYSFKSSLLLSFWAFCYLTVCFQGQQYSRTLHFSYFLCSLGLCSSALLLYSLSTLLRSCFTRAPAPAPALNSLVWRSPALSAFQLSALSSPALNSSPALSSSLALWLDISNRYYFWFIYIESWWGGERGIEKKSIHVSWWGTHSVSG